MISNWGKITDEEKQIIRNQRDAYERLQVLVWMVLISGLILLIAPNYFPTPVQSIPKSELSVSPKNDAEAVENGIHLETGMVYDENFEIVRANCTACHSAKLITQNRMSREAWDKTIIWMQETQKLWDLGPNHEKVLDYLAKNYAPQKEGRRKTIVVEEWYWIQ